jgi:hypothetical protein
VGCEVWGGVDAVGSATGVGEPAERGARWPEGSRYDLSTVPAFVHNVVFDAEQPRRLGRFWSEVTGYTVADERDDFVRLQAPAPGHSGPRQLLFIRVEDPTPGKNRVHGDLAARELETEVDRLIGLGAVAADGLEDGRPRWRDGNGIRWVVLRDPEGNEFCVGADPESMRPASLC